MRDLYSSGPNNHYMVKWCYILFISHGCKRTKEIKGNASNHVFIQQCYHSTHQCSAELHSMMFQCCKSTRVSFLTPPCLGHITSPLECGRLIPYGLVRLSYFQLFLVDSQVHAGLICNDTSHVLLEFAGITSETVVCFERWNIHKSISKPFTPLCFLIVIMCPSKITQHHFIICGWNRTSSRSTQMTSRYSTGLCTQQFKPHLACMEHVLDFNGFPLIMPKKIQHIYRQLWNVSVPCSFPAISSS